MEIKPTPPELLIQELHSEAVDWERKREIIVMLCGYGIVVYTALVHAGFGSELWLRLPNGEWRKILSLESVSPDQLRP